MQGLLGSKGDVHAMACDWELEGLRLVWGNGMQNAIAVQLRLDEGLDG